MLTLYKLMLGPALLWQGARVRRMTLRLPEAAGERAGIADAGADADADADAGAGARAYAGAGAGADSGARPALRLLFIGDSSVAGVGVDQQTQAMPRQAAERVSERLRRPVEWRAIAKSGVDTREALALFEREAAAPADVAVISLGVNDVTAQRGARRFFADYEGLMAAVRRRTGARTTVITGLPPLHRLPAAPQPLRWYLGQCAARMDRGLIALCASRLDRRFVSLGWARAEDMARDGFHPGKGQYRHWAGLVADQIVELVAAPVPH